MTAWSALGDRLDRLISLYEAAYSRHEPNWQVELQPAANDEQLDRVEEQLGRFLPHEARQLYHWHDGCIPSIVPDLRFNQVKVALDIYASLQYEATQGYKLPAVTNKLDPVDIAALFPVFNIDKTLLTVVTTVSRRVPTSALYLLDAEFDALTNVSYTVGDFIEHLIQELERGNVAYSVHGLRWKGDPYRFDPLMEPYGSEPIGRS